jgi:hypothetical protein
VGSRVVLHLGELFLHEVVVGGTDSKGIVSHVSTDLTQVSTTMVMALPMGNTTRMTGQASKRAKWTRAAFLPLASFSCWRWCRAKERGNGNQLDSPLLLSTGSGSSFLGSHCWLRVVLGWVKIWKARVILKRRRFEKWGENLRGFINKWAFLIVHLVDT